MSVVLTTYWRSKAAEFDRIEDKLTDAVEALRLDIAGTTSYGLTMRGIAYLTKAEHALRLADEDTYNWRMERAEDMFIAAEAARSAGV